MDYMRDIVLHAMEGPAAVVWAALKCFQTLLRLGDWPDLVLVQTRGDLLWLATATQAGPPRLVVRASCRRTVLFAILPNRGSGLSELRQWEEEGPVRVVVGQLKPHFTVLEKRIGDGLTSAWESPWVVLRNEGVVFIVQARALAGVEHGVEDTNWSVLHMKGLPDVHGADDDCRIFTGAVRAMQAAATSAPPARPSPPSE